MTHLNTQNVKGETHDRNRKNPRKNKNFNT